MVKRKQMENEMDLKMVKPKGYCWEKQMVMLMDLRKLMAIAMARMKECEKVKQMDLSLEIQMVIQMD